MQDAELRVRLEDSTNTLVLNYFTQECQGRCEISKGMFFIFNERGRSGDIHRTSLILDFIIEEKYLIVKTLNSVYKYEILSGTHEQFRSLLKELDIPAAQKIQEDRKTKAKIYFVQDSEGFIFPIKLQKAMDWDEVVTYVKNNFVDIRVVSRLQNDNIEVNNDY